jgi:dienelactone hydrolase
MTAMRPPGPIPAGDAFPRFAADVSVSVRVAGRSRASAKFERDVGENRSDAVSLRPAQDGFYGVYIRPHGAARGPAVLFLGGSEGGLPRAYAPLLLAARGYPVLGLAYFNAPGLPPELERIPLEYFAGALRWLARQPEVDPARIAVVGVSRGGELALLLGSTYPDLIHGVAAYVPSDLVNPSVTDFDTPAWTLGGRPVARAPIPVERIAGPVLAVGADDDHLWPSGTATRAIALRMRGHGRTDVTALEYRRAGHALGVMLPNVPTRTTVASRYGVLNMGGSPGADAAARADSWPKLLAFLARI